MIEQPIKARLPIIAVESKDPVNFSATIKHLVKKTPTLIKDTSPIGKDMTKGRIYYFLCRPKVTNEITWDYTTLYKSLMKNDQVLLLVNPSYIDDSVFDAGVLPVPKDMALGFMTEVVEDEAQAKALLATLGGCTLKEMSELAALTMQREQSLTPLGLSRTRKMFFIGTKGLTQVDTTLDFYEPPEMLVDWIKREKSFFLDGADERLRPRGLLLDGPPGVGKTEGAKYTASQFGIPLFRFDMASAKGKFVGESEKAVREALALVDEEEPCVMLIDEIDKISYGFGESSGVTASLFSQLLWWLAEHRSRVLTMMTVNNLAALPKELYRPGRVDEVMTFQRLDTDQAVAFVVKLMDDFGYEIGYDDAGKICKDVPDTDGGYSHAVLVQQVKKVLKQQ